LTASWTETWTIVMLRACGTGPWPAVTVAASAIRFHSITAFSTATARTLSEQPTRSPNVAAPIPMHLDMRTSWFRA